MKPNHYLDKEVVGEYDKERFQSKKWQKEYLDVIERGFVAKWAKGKVLDVGCGTGRMSFLDDYTGLDYSEEMILKARKLYPNKRFIGGNAMKLPFKNNSFDTVISFRLLMHLDNWKKAFKEIVRVVKKDGLIIIDTKTKLLSLPNKIRRNKINLISLKELPESSVSFSFPPVLALTKLIVIKNTLKTF
jgi:ubiquinone/menaquinone biosynthesis C-methylase UbiE